LIFVSVIKAAIPIFTKGIYGYNQDIIKLQPADFDVGGTALFL
jgi:hypothetical protein